MKSLDDVIALLKTLHGKELDDLSQIHQEEISRLLVSLSLAQEEIQSAKVEIEVLSERQHYLEAYVLSLGGIHVHVEDILQELLALKAKQASQYAKVIRQFQGVISTRVEVTALDVKLSAADFDIKISGKLVSKLRQ